MRKLSINKLKNKDFWGYFDVEVTDKITNKNHFFPMDIVDDLNIIKQISAKERMLNFKKCVNFKTELLKVFSEIRFIF